MFIVLTHYIYIVSEYWSVGGGIHIENEKESWYSDEKGQEIDEPTPLSLYLRYHESMDETLNRHFNVRNYYTVMLSALTGLYVGGILQLEIAKINVPRLSMLDFALLTLPVIVSLLSVVALLSTTRYYTAWLRRVVLVAKIENMLGIDNRVKTEKGRPRDLIWKKDETFMDKYYVDSRKAFEKSKKFIEKKRWRGDNLWATLTFVGFYILGVILLFRHIVWF